MAAQAGFVNYPKEDLLLMKVSCFGSDVYVQNRITSQVLMRFGYESERAALSAAMDLMDELDSALAA